MEKKSIKRRLFAGGSIAAIATGLIVECYAQFSDLKTMAIKNRENIAVTQNIDDYQEKFHNTLIDKLNVIEGDIKTLLRRRSDGKQ